MAIKINTIKMKCEKCHTPVSTMVALPRRKRADGTTICFWQLCLKCAKEVLNARQAKQNVRNLPNVPVSKDIEGRQTKKPVHVRRVQNVVRKLNTGGKDGNSQRIRSVNETRPNQSVKSSGSNGRSNQKRTCPQTHVDVCHVERGICGQKSAGIVKNYGARRTQRVK